MYVQPKKQGPLVRTVRTIQVKSDISAIFSAIEFKKIKCGPSNSRIHLPNPKNEVVAVRVLPLF